MSAPSREKQPPHVDEEESLRFSPEEEASLLAESHALKTSANALFATSRFSEAIGVYDQALASCPTYLDYEISVLKSNIAASHIRLSEWKEAAEAASAALDGLELIAPTKKPAKPGKATRGKDKDDDEPGEDDDPDTIVELDAADDEDEAALLEKLQLSDERKTQVANLRAKCLLRRARANAELGGWASLAAAEEDYKLLAKMPNLPPGDQKVVRQQLVALPQKVGAAKEQEMGEMMGKLKDLGNGLLKPFGLSTDMFKFQKDEKTGGYNMSFGDGKS